MDAFQILVEQGALSASDLARAQALSAQRNLQLAPTLMRLGMVSESELAAAMGIAHDCPKISLADLPREVPSYAGLNRHFLQSRHLLPVALESGELTLAMADPADADAVAALRFAYGAKGVKRLVGTFSDLDEALAAAFPPELPDQDVVEESGIFGEDLERLAESQSDAPIIRLVHRLLANAALRRASDVHIEPMARHVSVRYRIDGHLIEVERLADSVAASVASRIKVMSGLDIAESRLPQDGRLRFTVQGRDVDVRVSTSPIAHGESIVLRLLGRTNVALDLRSLGLPTAAREKFERVLGHPHGIILLTGPTGSGKTTTLYAAINRLKRPDVKILTVEDPVEIILEGINQVQVRPEIELTYANALRAFLRQDPDILMVGEIRDRETADIAMRAALTGHLVLSTLHTQSAVGAFTRLADIGIEPFLTASTVVATLAQRLVRALCSRCKRARPPRDYERLAFERAGLSVPYEVMEPIGCPVCGQTGYHGRIPLMEIFVVDGPARAAIREGRCEELEGAMPLPDTLLGHGLALVSEGRTDMTEVERTVAFT